jgi:hypothetical protein
MSEIRVRALPRCFGYFLGEVDSLNITTVPVMLGDGTPLMSPPYAPTKLALKTHRVYKSGTIFDDLRVEILVPIEETAFWGRNFPQ